MSEKVIEILEKFSEHLDITTPIAFIIRVIGWMIIKGLAWIVDGLENVTNIILGLKLFYQNPSFVDFIESFQPVLVILFAFNILFIGYLLIFQRKFNREGVLTNVIMALIILVLLGSGMQQADRFATEAINAINVDETDTVATKIIKDNITDLSQFDLNDWKTPDLEEPNKIPQDNITNINITETIDEEFKFESGKTISSLGNKVLTNTLTYSDAGKPKTTELDNGWFTMFDQAYYRWSWDFWNMFLTLGIMAVVLVTISIKLAKLFFELAFNQALATFVAPTDMHSGQKMKAVIQSILSIFIVMIMMFLSLKVYLIGSEWIGEQFDGIVYFIGMIGFAMAVIDGPNIVERLFGIDAGIKSGWGALAGTYALARGSAGVAKGIGKGATGVAQTTGAVGGKAMSGVGGATGFVQGMAASQNQPNKTSNNGNKNDTPKENEQENKSRESEDANQISGDYGSSLEKEMNDKYGQDNQSKPSNKQQSIHDEMKQKGYTSNARSNGQSNFSNSLVGNNSSSVNPQNKEMASAKVSDSSPSFSNETGSISSMESENSTPNISNNVRDNAPQMGGKIIEKDEKNNQNIAPENRHIGQVMKEKSTQTIKNNKAIQNTKRSYQIGKNTGNSIKKNYKKHFNK